MSAKTRTADPGRRRLWRRFAVWHAAGSALALMIVSLRYFQLSPFPPDLPGRAFLALAVPSHFFGLAFLASLPVLAASWLRPGAWLLVPSTLLQVGALLVVCVDTQVYALYRSHIDGMVIGLLSSGVASDVLQPTAADLADLGAMAGAVVAVQLALAWMAFEIASRSARGPVWLSGLIAPFLLAQAIHAWADAGSLPSVTRSARVLPWLPGLTAKRWLAARGWSQPRSRSGPPDAAGASDLSYPLQSPDCRAEREDVRILMVVIEEWRADQLSPVTTPEIWDFASGSLVFERHFSSGSTSRYGVFGLFYGLHGSYWDAMLAERRGPVLIDELLARDVRFFVAATAPLTRPEFDRTVFAALRDRVPFVQPAAATPSAGDREITNAFASFAAEVAQEPFFAVLYYDSPHSMDRPEDWRGPHPHAQRWGSRLALNDRTDPAPLRQGHDNSVHYVDSLVGEALEALRRNGLLERTTVVITGDHGEEFNDLGQGYWGHNGNFARFQTQVGMVMRIPGRPAARVGSLTSHVDVVPTLMQEVLACRAPPESYSSGRSLLDSASRDYVVASGGSLGVGIVEPDRITTIGPFGDVSVFDRELEREPGPPDARLLRRVYQELASFRGGTR